MFTEEKVKAMIREVMAMEKGRGVSEADAVFKRGYRTALRHMTDLVNAARDRNEMLNMRSK